MTDPGAHPIHGHLHAADGTTTRIDRAPGTGNDGDVIIGDGRALRWADTGWEDMPVVEARQLLAQRTDTDE